MKNNEEKVRSIYQKFETKFHIDGLYWLQYGLALRDFDLHREALEKLKTAREAYTSPQIKHAYAQQLMIIAEMAPVWKEAEPLLDEAISALRELNRDAEETDAYPIVTLAEGHISVILRFFGVDGARSIWQQYANELYAWNQKQPAARIQEAVDKIVALSTNGNWKPSYGSGYLDEI